MKKIIAALCILFTGAVTCAQMKPIATRINSVTVYSDRALVTRTGRMQLAPGSYALAIAGVPAVMEDRSVKVSGEAAGAKITDVRVETTYLDTVPDERVTKLLKLIDDLKHEQTMARYRVSALQNEWQFLSEIKPQPGAGTGDARAPKYSVEDWQKSLAFMSSNLQRVSAAKLAGEEEIQTLQKKIDAAQKQLSEITAHLQRQTKTIIVDVDVQKSGDVQLSASYVVYNARWFPQYDVRASRDANTVAIDYRGAVQQSTGEDWTNVDLALSTARPDVGGVKPELAPWFVNEARPVQPFMRGTGAAMMKMEEKVGTPVPVPDAEVKPDGEAEETEMAPMEELEAAIETGMTSVQYAIPAKSTVPSDNIVHKVGITSGKFPAEFSYLAVPKLSPYVYLKGSVKNTGEFPLLPGIVNVFGEREFIAQSALKLVAPGETFDAYFGVDPSVSIERKLINKSTEYTGTFSKTVKVTYDFQYTLQNRKNTAVTVGVEDQLPISQNEKIMVEPLEPKNLTPNEQGIVTFTQTLKPSEKKTWAFRFSLEYPRDMKISGIE